MSNEETNNQTMPEKDCVQELRNIIRLNQIMHVHGTGDRLSYKYGVPVAHTQTPIRYFRGWGVTDFRPLVHTALRLILLKPTREHQEDLCRQFIKQALQQFDITEDANNMLIVIDTFIPDVYKACVYRSEVHQNLYGPWRAVMERIGATSLLHTITDYVSGNLFDTLRVKRISPENASTITVDTIHAMTFGSGNDVNDAYENRYVLVHWRIVHTVEQEENQTQSLENQRKQTWFSSFVPDT